MRDEVVGLMLDVGLVGRDRPDQVHRRRPDRLLVHHRRDHEAALRVAQQPAGHGVGAGIEMRGQLLHEAGRDVLALLLDHDPVQDFPLHRPRAGIAYTEHGFARRHGE